MRFSFLRPDFTDILQMRTPYDMPVSAPKWLYLGEKLADLDEQKKKID